MVVARCVMVVSGILAFTDASVRALMDLKVFVDEDADTCLARRSALLP